MGYGVSFTMAVAVISGTESLFGARVRGLGSRGYLCRRHLASSLQQCRRPLLIRKLSPEP